MKLAAILIAVLLTVSAAPYTVRAEEGACESDAALRTCQGDVKTVQGKLADVTSDLTATKESLNEAKKKATAAASEASEAKKALAALKDEAKQLEKRLKDAVERGAKLQTLERELSQLRANFKNADTEASTLRARAEQAEKRLQELASHHHTAWLPHWLEESAGAAWSRAVPVVSAGVSSARHMFDQGVEAAGTAWTTYAAPSARQVTNAATKAARSAYATASQKLGASGFKLPIQVTNAFAAAQKAITAITSSDIVAKLLDISKTAGSAFLKHASTVVSELESLMVGLLSRYPAAAPLTTKPLSTVTVFAFLGAPVVAFVLPMIASRRSSTRSSSKKQKRNGSKKSQNAAAVATAAVSSSQTGGDSFKTPTQRRKKRISVGGDSVNVPT